MKKTRMKTVKFILLICIIVSFSQCNTIKLTATAPFKITGANYHTWVGGQPGVHGTNLIIGVYNDSQVIVKSIYFRNRKNQPSIENRKGKKYVVVNIPTSKRNRNEEIIETSTKKTKKSTATKNEIPFKLASDQAVIQYMVGNKTFYYKILKIKKKETLFYP
jgi:uncharacterized membrane protein